MRSELIFGAMERVPNRFLLVQALSAATRGFHKPGIRIQDTVNDILVRFGHADPIARAESVREPAGAPVFWRRPHPCWKSDAVLELERILDYQSTIYTRGVHKESGNASRAGV